MRVIAYPRATLSEILNNALALSQYEAFSKQIRCSHSMFSMQVQCLCDNMGKKYDRELPVYVRYKCSMIVYNPVLQSST